MDLQHVLRRHKTRPPHRHPDVPELTSGMEGTGQHGSLWLSAPGSDLSPSHGGGHWRAHVESEDAWQPRVPGERRRPLHRGATAAKGHQRQRGGVRGAWRSSGQASPWGWHHPEGWHHPGGWHRFCARLTHAMGQGLSHQGLLGERQQPKWRSCSRPADGAVGPCLMPSWRARSLCLCWSGSQFPCQAGLSLVELFSCSDLPWQRHRDCSWSEVNKHTSSSFN